MTRIKRALEGGHLQQCLQILSLALVKTWGSSDNERSCSKVWCLCLNIVPSDKSLRLESKRLGRFHFSREVCFQELRGFFAKFLWLLPPWCNVFSYIQGKLDWTDFSRVINFPFALTWNILWGIFSLCHQLLDTEGLSLQRRGQKLSFTSETRESCLAFCVVEWGKEHRTWNNICWGRVFRTAFKQFWRYN